MQTQQQGRIASAATFPCAFTSERWGQRQHRERHVISSVGVFLLFTGAAASVLSGLAFLALW